MKNGIFIEDMMINIQAARVRPAAAAKSRGKLWIETRSNADLVIRDSCGVQIMIYRAVDR